MPGPTPTVSAVVPAYNGVGLIERCLDALLAQRGECLEVIVVDDGSMDATCEVVAPRSSVQLVRQARQGVAAARNVGIAAALAPFIGFCDQDDEWLPGKAQAQADYLRQHPDVAAVLCQSEVRFHGVERPSWLGTDQHGRPGGVMPLSGLFRAAALDRVGGFVSTAYANDDLDLLVRLREAGARIEVSDEVLVRRNIHERNASHELGSYEPGLLDVMRRRVARARR